MQTQSTHGSCQRAAPRRALSRDRLTIRREEDQLTRCVLESWFVLVEHVDKVIGNVTSDLRMLAGWQLVVRWQILIDTDGQLPYLSRWGHLGRYLSTKVPKYCPSGHGPSILSQPRLCSSGPVPLLLYMVSSSCRPAGRRNQTANSRVSTFDFDFDFDFGTSNVTSDLHQRETPPRPSIIPGGSVDTSSRPQTQQ